MDFVERKQKQTEHVRDSQVRMQKDLKWEMMEDEEWKIGTV